MEPNEAIKKLRMALYDLSCAYCHLRDCVEAGNKELQELSAQVNKTYDELEDKIDELRKTRFNWSMPVTFNESNTFHEIFDRDIVDISFYPRWEKKQIKRKYGNRPAIYLDVWRPYSKPLCAYLPRQKLKETEWRTR